MRSVGQPEALSRCAGSDRQREFVEDRAELVMGGDVGGDVVVAAAQVLYESVASGQDPRGPVAFQSAHRSEPGFQPAMVSLDRVIGIALDDVQR